MNKIAIIGAGNMGTTLGGVIAENGHEILLCGVDKNVVDSINNENENIVYLPGVKLSKNISATLDLEELVNFSDIIVIAIPSIYLRSTIQKIPKELLKNKIIVNCTKGIELDSLKLTTDVLKEELGEDFNGHIADLSGPSIAKELSQKMLTAVMIACDDNEVLSKLKKIFTTSYFRVETSNDMIGVELGGVIKNVYSIGIGICDVLVGSMNTRALLLTEALKEMCQLGVKMGADKHTFYQLSGFGDLVATCLSEHSRNRRFGKLFAEGDSIEHAQKEIGQITEGYYAAEAIHKLSKIHGIKMPFAEHVYQILYENGEAKELLLKGI